MCNEGTRPQGLLLGCELTDLQAAGGGCRGQLSGGVGELWGT